MFDKMSAKTNNGTWPNAQAFKRAKVWRMAYKYCARHWASQQTLDAKTADKMKTCMLTLALCAYLVRADVSHLSSSYLPPAKPAEQEHAVNVSSEQQELRELPEQVEYMREEQPEQSAMEPEPSSLLMPPAVEGADMPSMPADRYLPSAQLMDAAQLAPEAPEEPAVEYVAPEPAMQIQNIPLQPNYQQYQEQLQHAQINEPEQMPYYMDVQVQQPMAPSDAQTLSYAEPLPAHELQADGYHYRAAAAEQRLRH